MGNDELCRRCGKNVSVCEKEEQNVLIWFDHTDRMGDQRLVKRLYNSDIMVARRRERPRKGWLDEVNDCCWKKGY